MEMSVTCAYCGMRSRMVAPDFGSLRRFKDPDWVFTYATEGVGDGVVVGDGVGVFVFCGG